MSGKEARVYEGISDPEMIALFERNQKAQDAVMAAVGDKRRVGGKITCPVCGSGTLRYFVHEDYWDAPHNSGQCSTEKCVHWAM